MQMLQASIWDDINVGAEAIVITDISYPPTALTNKIYEMVDPVQRRQTLLKNNIKGLYKHVPDILEHCQTITTDEAITTVINHLIAEPYRKNITAVDRLFINAYYRCILRAHLEDLFKDKPLFSGLIITEDAGIDVMIVRALRLIKVICRFLGINNTFTVARVPNTKLSVVEFWSNISENAMGIWGEDKITLIGEESGSLAILLMLNVIFHSWSGSTVTVDENNIIIMPAAYITRLLPKINTKAKLFMDQ